MHSFTTNQQTILSSASKTIYWLFEIDSTNFWSTKTVPDTVYNSQAYSFKVLPDSLSGVLLSRPMSEQNMIAPSEIEFEITNPGNTLAAGDFEDTTCIVKLVISDGTLTELFHTWTFYVNRCEPLDQKLKFSCKDILQKYLEGDWPDRILVSSINPGELTIQDNLCVPIIYGTAYIPVRGVYFSDDNYYVIGMSTETDVTADKLRSPTDSIFGISTYPSSSYTYTYPTKTVGSNSFRTLHADAGDGTNILFPDGPMLDPSVNLTDSGSVTAVGDVIESVLEAFGVPSALLDTGVGSSFTAVNTACAARGLNGMDFNMGFFAKQSKRDILALLLNAAHLTIAVTDKIELHTIAQNNADYVATFDDSLILKNGEASADTTFSYNLVDTEGYDAGNLAFQKPGEPINKLVRIVSAVGSTEAHVSTETFELPIIFDTTSEAENSKLSRTASRLYFQRKYLQKANIGFTSMPANLTSPTASPLGVQPDDVIRINDTRYGGTYYALVNTVRIKHGLEVEFDCTVFTSELENWGDYTATAVTISADGSSGTWTPVVAGATIESSEGGMLNSLPGVLNIGTYSTGKYITLEPNDPVIKLVNTTDMISLGKVDTDIYGIKINDAGGNTVIQIDSTPQAVIAGWTIDSSKIYNSNAYLHSDGYISFGATPPTSYGNNVGVWLGYSTGAKISLYADTSNYLQWDGSKLLVKAANFTLDSSGNITASNATVSGSITAGSGAIGGWSIDSTKISITGIELDSGNNRIRAYTGSNYVDITAGGVTGYDSVLGTTFKLLTDGSAPEFSSGVIKETEYQMYTSGIIKTGANPTTGGGLLINNVSLSGYNSAGLKLLQFIYSGTDQGDAYIGDYDSGNHGLKYDHSAGTLSLKGSITIVGGVDYADITGTKPPADAEANTIDAGDGLAALDSTASTKLSGIEEGADVTDATNVGAQFSNTISTIDTQVDRTETALDSSSRLVTAVIPTLAVTPSVTGLYLSQTHMGYYDTTAGAWKTYMDNTGNFYLGGTSGKLQWNGTTLSVEGNITISNPTSVRTTLNVEDGAQANTIDAGDGLAALDSTASTKLSGIEDGATAGATWGSDLIPPDRFGDSATLGLNLTATHMGYWNGTNWMTYMDSDGKFYLGGTSGKLQWNGTTLSIEGNITISNPTSVRTTLNVEDGAQANTIDAGDGLAALDSTASTKLSGIEEGATVGATWGSDLIPPDRFSDSATLGLNLTATHMGYWNGSNWMTYMDSDGKFYLGGTSGKLQWNGTTLSIEGNITISNPVTVRTDLNVADGATAGATWGVNIGSQPIQLSDINSTEGTKLSGIADGATVGATWGSNLSSIPNRFTDSATTGLNLTATYLGYYTGSAWTAYIDSNGKAYFGDGANEYFQYDTVNGVQISTSQADGITIKSGGGITVEDNGGIAFYDSSSNLMCEIRTDATYSMGLFFDGPGTPEPWIISEGHISIWPKKSMIFYYGDGTTAPGTAAWYSETDGEWYFNEPTHFANFPITPSSAPSTDYQVANKKYVDDSISGTGQSYAVYVEENDASKANSASQALYLDFLGADFNISVVGNECNISIADGGIDHDSLSNYVAGEHFLQSAITAISSGVGSGILVSTSGTLSAITNSSTNWNTAYSHSQTAHAPSTAEANVNADWNATSGDAEILNKPTLGSQLSSWEESGTVFRPTVAGYNLGDTTHELGHIYQGDTKYHYFGADQDAKIFHSGNHFYLDSTTGAIYFRTGATPDNALIIYDSQSSKFLGSVEIEVNGTSVLTIDGVDGGGSPAATAKIMMDGYGNRGKGIWFTDDAHADETFIGQPYLGSGIAFQVGFDTLASGQAEYNANALFSIKTDGTVRLPLDGSTSASYFSVGASDDLKIYHNGSHSVIREEYSGDFYIDKVNASGSLILRTGAGPATALTIDSSQDATFAQSVTCSNIHDKESSSTYHTFHLDATNTTGITWIGCNQFRYYYASNQFARSSATEMASMIVLNNEDIEFYNMNASSTGIYSLTPTLVITGEGAGYGNVKIPRNGSSSASYFSVGADDDLKIYHTTGDGTYIRNGAGGLYLYNAAAASTILYTNATIALTIDSSQDAAFAGNVTAANGKRFSVYDGTPDEIAAMGWLTDLKRNNAHGTTTGSTTNTITDSTATWETNELVGLELYITSGTYSGEHQTVQSNTATQITVDTVFSGAPGTGVTYEVRYTSDYWGFWAESGDKLIIDGDITYESGDWIISNNARVKIANSSGNTVLVLGQKTTNNSEYGLFVYDDAGTTLLASLTGSGIVLDGGTFSSSDWAAAAGIRLDLDNKWLKMGGSNVTYNPATSTAGIFLGYEATATAGYKLYIGDGSNEYFAYNPSDGIQISTAQAEGITIKSGGGITVEDNGGIAFYDSSSNLMCEIRTDATYSMGLFFDGPGTPEPWIISEGHISLWPKKSMIFYYGDGTAAPATTAWYAETNGEWYFNEPTHFADNLYLGNSDYLYFGDDMYVYHSGTHGYITNETGSLYIQTGATPTTALTIDSSQDAVFAGDVTIDNTAPYLLIGDSSVSTGTCKIQIGKDRTGNGYAHIDLAGDATYSTYGLRMIRNNTGANTNSIITHRGTGDFVIKTEDAASLVFSTNATTRCYIASTGSFLPNLTATYNIGAAVARWNYVYCVTCDQSSDIKHKENIEKETLGIDFINKLSPVTWNWKKEFKNDSGTQHGLIAQDVLATIESLGYQCNDFAGISNNNDEWGLAYTDFIGPMILSIQQLDKKIESVEDRLRRRVEELEQEIELLKAA